MLILISNFNWFQFREREWESESAAHTTFRYPLPTSFLHCWRHLCSAATRVCFCCNSRVDKPITINCAESIDESNGNLLAKSQLQPNIPHPLGVIVHDNEWEQVIWASTIGSYMQVCKYTHTHTHDNCLGILVIRCDKTPYDRPQHELLF